MSVIAAIAVAITELGGEEVIAYQAIVAGASCHLAISARQSPCTTVVAGDLRRSFAPAAAPSPSRGGAGDMDTVATTVTGSRTNRPGSRWPRAVLSNLVTSASSSSAGLCDLCLVRLRHQHHRHGGRLAGECR